MQMNFYDIDDVQCLIVIGLLRNHRSSFVPLPLNFDILRNCLFASMKGGRKQYHRNYSIANQMPNEMFFVCICTAFGNFKFCANETEKLACNEILRNWIVEKYSSRVIYCYSNYLRLSLSLRINKQLKQMKRAWDRKRLFQRVCLFIYFFVGSFSGVCASSLICILFSRFFLFLLSQLKKVIK